MKYTLTNELTIMIFFCENLWHIHFRSHFRPLICKRYYLLSSRPLELSNVKRETIVINEYGRKWGCMCFLQGEYPYNVEHKINFKITTVFHILHIYIALQGKLSFSFRQRSSLQHFSHFYALFLMLSFTWYIFCFIHVYFSSGLFLLDATTLTSISSVLHY